MITGIMVQSLPTNHQYRAFELVDCAESTQDQNCQTFFVCCFLWEFDSCRYSTRQAALARSYIVDLRGLTAEETIPERANHTYDYFHLLRPVAVRYPCSVCRSCDAFAFQSARREMLATSLSSSLWSISRRTTYFRSECARRRAYGRYLYAFGDQPKVR